MKQKIIQGNSISIFLTSLVNSYQAVVCYHYRSETDPTRPEKCLCIATITMHSHCQHSWHLFIVNSRFLSNYCFIWMTCSFCPRYISHSWRVAKMSHTYHPINHLLAHRCHMRLVTPPLPLILSPLPLPQCSPSSNLSAQCSTMHPYLVSQMHMLSPQNKSLWVISSSTVFLAALTLCEMIKKNND